MDNEVEFDKLLMLFSADWFFPFITLLVPNMDDVSCKAIRQVARDTIRIFMINESVYWNISFSKKRLQGTTTHFTNMLKMTYFSDKKIDKLYQYIKNATDTDESEKTTLWLFGMLTEALLAEDTTLSALKINQKKIEIIKEEALKESNKKRYYNFEKLALASTTSWDKYLRNLTPDLPTYLSDYAENYLANFDIFRMFWFRISKRLNKSDLKVLIKWYIKNSLVIADSEVNLKLPIWMVNLGTGHANHLKSQ